MIILFKPLIITVYRFSFWESQILGIKTKMLVIVATIIEKFYFNRHRPKLSKVNASIFDLALSHTRRSDSSEKREENSVVVVRSLFNVFACEQVSSSRLYRLIPGREKNFQAHNVLKLKLFQKYLNKERCSKFE